MNGKNVFSLSLEKQQRSIVSPVCSPLRDLQPSDSAGLLPAVLPVGLLDLRRVGSQRDLRPLAALWGSVRTSGCKHPKSVRGFSFSGLLYEISPSSAHCRWL